MVKIFKYDHLRDFGDDYHFRFITVGKYTLFNVILSWSDYGGWPYFQVSGGLGYGSLLMALFSFGKAAIEVRLLDEDYRVKH